MKRYVIALLACVVLLTSCHKDIGNYDLKDLGDIKIEGIPATLEVLGFVDRIVISPKLTSSLEGEITADNPNYSFRYRLGYKGIGALGGVVDGVPQAWVELTPKDGYKLDVPANYAPSTYICWFTITDNRNNTVTSQLFDVKVSSTTFEGWMVVCNEGPTEKARLDMISLLSSTRTEALHNISVSLPAIYHATQFAFHPSQQSGLEITGILSRTDSYLLNGSTFETNLQNEFNKNVFISPPLEKMTYMTSLSAPGDFPYMTKYTFLVSEAGNAYCRDNGEGGAVFALPINTSSPGGVPGFKVAPFVGFSQVRPGNSSSALFYDIDNKRFMGFQGSRRHQLSILPDPVQKLFSFQTGKDMVYMEGTRRSNGLVYSILQDAQGKRSIYGINMSGAGFAQESYYENITAPGFQQATLFAFHSQFPLMFYAVGNKVYMYNLATQVSYELTNISGAEITCLKFNLYKNSALTNLNKQTEAFLNQQFQLIVGSFNNEAGDINAGKVTFYEVNGVNNTVNKLSEYSGFAKVKDVTYRERTK